MLRALRLAALGGCFLASAAAAQENFADARAQLIDRDGKPAGNAILSRTEHGVLIEVTATGLPEGWHGFHIHETGTCDPATGFTSAGGHFAPRGNEHGYRSAGGFHAGDLPNQYAGASGELWAEVHADRVTLDDGEDGLLDADGSALVIHAGRDDHASQPAGDAGDRLLCGVIEPV